MPANSKHARSPSRASSALPRPVVQKPEDVNPGYFIVRPNGGPLVPLIPIDELPIGLDFVGLKRSIEVEDTIGMANLGIRTNKVGYWQLIAQKADVGKEVAAAADQGILTAVLAAAGEDVATPVNAPNTPLNAEGFKHADVAIASSISSISSPSSEALSLASSSASSAGSSSRPMSPDLAKDSQPHAVNQPPNEPGVKTFPSIAGPNRPTTSTVPPPTGPGIIGPFRPQICRHWCAYGLCKWGENCRYLHIMPTSRSGLQEVGLADWPTWWRNIIGIPGIMNYGGGGNVKGGGTASGIASASDRERERIIGKMSVYPTGPRERFSRGLDIDYGRSGGDALLARKWEDRLMGGRGRGRGRGRGGGGVGGVIQELDFRMLSGVGVQPAVGTSAAGGTGNANAKNTKGKQRRNAISGKSPQFLQPVLGKDGKIFGVTVADGSALKKTAEITTTAIPIELKPEATKGKQEKSSSSSSSPPPPPPEVSSEEKKKKTSKQQDTIIRAKASKEKSPPEEKPKPKQKSKHPKTQLQTAKVITLAKPALVTVRGGSGAAGGGASAKKNQEEAKKLDRDVVSVTRAWEDDEDFPEVCDGGEDGDGGGGGDGDGNDDGNGDGDEGSFELGMQQGGGCGIGGKDGVLLDI